jgi:hypothetical protein
MNCWLRDRLGDDPKASGVVRSLADGSDSGSGTCSLATVLLAAKGT